MCLCDEGIVKHPVQPVDLSIIENNGVFSEQPGYMRTTGTVIGYVDIRPVSDRKKKQFDISYYQLQK
jgi:hypothetical protein